MLLSRTIARHRIAVGVRPGAAAAWAPVAGDAAALVFVAVMLFPTLRDAIAQWQPPLPLLVVALFVGVYVPVQAVMILSSLWAARSRYRDEDAPAP